MSDLGVKLARILLENAVKQAQKKRAALGEDAPKAAETTEARQDIGTGDSTTAASQPQKAGKK